MLTLVVFCAQESDAEIDPDMIRELVKDTLFSTQPAMILNLRACVSSTTVRPLHYNYAASVFLPLALFLACYIRLEASKLKQKSKAARARITDLMLLHT